MNKRVHNSCSRVPPSGNEAVVSNRPQRERATRTPQPKCSLKSRSSVCVDLAWSGSRDHITLANRSRSWASGLTGRCRLFSRSDKGGKSVSSAIVNFAKGRIKSCVKLRVVATQAIHALATAFCLEAAKKAALSCPLIGDWRYQIQNTVSGAKVMWTYDSSKS
jgi:hypothetical protein